MPDQIRIVFVGDAKCGKSSLIDSILYTSFDNDCPSIVEEPMIRIGDENPVNIILNDSCSVDERNQTVLNLLNLADVIVYVIDSVEIISTKINVNAWLEVINSESLTAPVIVVANKIDCISEQNLSLLRDFFVRLLSLSSKIEVCLECSAKNQQNIDSIIQYAVKLSRYPLDPLLNRSTNLLTAEATRCLIYIHRYFNTSNSRFLTNPEFCSFYKQCYGKEIGDEEMHEMLVQLESLGYHCEQGISEEAFLEWMRNYLLHDQQENVWTAIRAMNFSENLVLNTSFELPDNAIVELSNTAEQFLISLFKSFDRPSQGTLTLSDMGELFATTVDYPWSLSASNGNMFVIPDFLQNSLVHNEVRIDVVSWLNEWKILMRTDPACAIQQLLELGWHGRAEELFCIKRNKEEEWALGPKLTRTCMHAFVIGCAGVGKTALLNRFMSKPISHCMTDDEVTSTVMNLVKNDGGVINSLCLTEVQESETMHVLETYHNLCDMVCCVFDVTKPSSFLWVRDIIDKLANGTKILLIGTKTDLLRIPYEETDLYEMVKQTVDANELESPLITSFYSRDPLYSIIFNCSVYSEICEKKKVVEEKKTSSGWILPVISVLGILVSGFYIWHHRK